MRYNPPPGWPTPAPGWVPPPGWQPDPAWGPAPHGWPLWIEDTVHPQVIVQQSPKRGRIGCLSVIAVVVVLVAIGAALPKHKSKPSPTSPVGNQSAPADDNGSHPAAADVTLGTCSIDQSTGWPSCAVTITNHSSKASNYLVTLSELSKDKATKYGDMLVTVNSLAPGQTSPQTAQGFDKVPADSTVEVSEVQRYASP